MKAVFSSHCNDSWYRPVGAEKLYNSSRYFHPEIEMHISGDADINRVLNANKWAKSIRGGFGVLDPLIAELYLDQYDLIVHFDADSIITGRLDELLSEDFEVAGVRNNNDLGLCSRTGSKLVTHLPSIDASTQYLNAGLIAATKKEFWKEFKLLNQHKAVNYPFHEQDIFNLIFYNGKYKTKILDPIDSNVYYGTSQQICPNGDIRSAWTKLYIKNNELYSNGKKVKVIHNADGSYLPKLQYKGWTSPEVRDFLDTITH